MATILKIATIKSAQAFRDHAQKIGAPLPCDDVILQGDSSPLTQPVPDLQLGGKSIANRWVVQPMEGWDGTPEGKSSEDTRRRWSRFGESGASLIFGGEAMAVTAEGRANPRQLILNADNREDLASLKQLLVATHQQHFGTSATPVVGFQLTHSGRFCRPNQSSRWEPRVAFRHPLLDARFGVVSDRQVMQDAEVRSLIQSYVAAARVAWEAGADFVDLKHCHGYLLHEFLAAHARPGPYGGSFENRTRILREIVEGIRADRNPIDLAVRLSAFDWVPFMPDATRAEPGKLGHGIPVAYANHLPYRYAFGINFENPVEPDLSEAHAFLQLCHHLGIRLINLTAGSPYYNPHIQRPALFPPSDGYQPPEDPLVGVFRQMQVVRELKAKAPSGMVVIGSGYSYLQEFLPHVAQAAVREGWTDMVGLGRMILSYPGVLSDAAVSGKLTPKKICRTFSDCTTAPRNGLVSGCYPLDPYYAALPDAAGLKEMKRGGV